MNFVSNYPRPSRYLVKSETFCQSRYRYSYYMLHYSPIYPFLIFGVHAWVLTFPSFLTPLLVIQKKAIRIITFSEPRSHSASLFKYLKSSHYRYSLLFISGLTDYYHHLFMKILLSPLLFTPTPLTSLVMAIFMSLLLTLPNIYFW